MLTLVSGAAAFALLLPLVAQATGPGDLDPAFGGGDGMATFSLSSESESIGTVLATTGGRILLLGEDDGPVESIAVARLTAAGDPDTGFGGGDGKVRMQFLDGSDAYNGLVVLPSGKIAVAVATSASGGRSKLGVGQFTASGVADSTFGGGDGKVIIDLGKDFYAYDMVALPSGKLLICGEFYVTDDDAKFLVVRLKANGTLDHSFGGGDGIAQTQFRALDDGAWRIALDTQGRIVVDGWVEEAGGGGDYDIGVARYMPDGAPDHTFSGDGRVVTQMFEHADDWAYGLGLQGNKIVVGAHADPGDGRKRIALLRYLPGGGLDPDFGGGDGEVITPNGDTSTSLEDLAIDGNNRILASATVATSPTQFLVARYSPSGKLDTGFGTDGFATASFASGSSEANLSVAGNGKVVVAGHTGGDTAVARFLP